jgi:YVTN family beta-propeller protein
MGIAVSKDGRQLYVANGRGNSLAVIDAVSHRFPVGGRPWGIALTPDGKKIYVANRLSNDISVIEAAARRVVATVKAGDGPWGITILPRTPQQPD